MSSAPGGSMVSEPVWEVKFEVGYYDVAWICPLAWGGADTCSLCSAVRCKKSRRTSDVRKDRWGKPVVLRSHNNLRETAGPHTSRKKWKLPAHSTASFVCVTPTCWHASRAVLFPGSSKFISLHLAGKWGTLLFNSVHPAAQICSINTVYYSCFNDRLY